jgi:GGDEF domain-containing protein
VPLPAQRIGSASDSLISFRQQDNRIFINANATRSNSSYRRNLNTLSMLCTRVRDMAIEHAGSERGLVTVSIGTATMNAAGVREKKQLLRSADEALYAAKAAGRDCVRSRERSDHAAVA